MLEIIKVQKTLKKLEKKIAVASPVVKKRLMKTFESLMKREQILLREERR